MNILRRHNPTIQLPNERVKKRDELSDALGGATLSAAIGRLLEMAADQGLVSHEIPGVELRRASDGIALRFDHASLVYLDAGLRLAEIVRGAATPGADFRSGSDERICKASRKGKGIPVVPTRGDGQEEVLLRNVALDCAKLIECKVGGSV